MGLTHGDERFRVKKNHLITEPMIVSVKKTVPIFMHKIRSELSGKKTSVSVHTQKKKNEHQH